VTISGTIYDITARTPIESVAVLSTSGRGAITDSLGHYAITVRKTDSIWFSMIGKTTMKFPVDTISNPLSFDLMIHLHSADLPEVKVRNHYYKLDSLENRKEYAKIFNFRKPTLRLSENTGYNPGGLTVGFDLDEIINMFRFKRNRQIEMFQRRLLQQEQDAYIDHRFTKLFVRKLTNLESPELEVFMRLYRPNYELLQQFNDLEFGYYIELSFSEYKRKKAAAPPAFVPSTQH
jgi:hypothetical protein